MVKNARTNPLFSDMDFFLPSAGGMSAPRKPPHGFHPLFLFSQHPIAESLGPCALRALPAIEAGVAFGSEGAKAAECEYSLLRVGRHEACITWHESRQDALFFFF